MPELPEVETTLRGIAPHILNKKFAQIIVRKEKLRWKIPNLLAEILCGQTVQNCRRRAKYLLIEMDTGVLIIHLGMSGSLRIFRDTPQKAGKHDHADFIFEDGTLLRYHDPRRFGAILWFAGVAEHHELLQKLGVEPLSDEFTATYLLKIPFCPRPQILVNSCLYSQPYTSNNQNDWNLYHNQELLPETKQLGIRRLPLRDTA